MNREYAHTRASKSDGSGEMSLSTSDENLRRQRAMPLLRRRQNGSFECFDAMKKGQLRIGTATPERGVEDERKVSFELAAMASSSKLRSRINLLLKYLRILFLTNH